MFVKKYPIESAKEIQFLIGGIESDDILFGGYFSREAKQIVVLAGFALILSLLIGCMAFRCHKYRKSKTSDSQEWTKIHEKIGQKS